MKLTNNKKQWAV